MNPGGPPARSGSARVRDGYLSADERAWMASLIDAVDDCLRRDEPMPTAIRVAFGGVAAVLSRPRDKFR